MEKYKYIMQYLDKDKFCKLAGVSKPTLLKWERSERVTATTNRAINQTIQRLHEAMRWDV